MKEYKTLNLIRLHDAKTSQDGTAGVLMYNGRPLCCTLELPWEDNKQNVSCIPDGVYWAKRIISPSHGETFEVQDVFNRTHIQFHPGNTTDDSFGCILPGRSFGELMGKMAVMDSKVAFHEFMGLLSGESRFELVITVYCRDCGNR